MLLRQYVLWSQFMIMLIFQPTIMFHLLWEGGHFVFGVDPVGDSVCVGVGMTLSCLHNYLVNQWLDSYQIFMDT